MLRNAAPGWTAVSDATVPDVAARYLRRPHPRLPSVVPWILLIVAGALGMLLAIGIIMIPGVLFLLGGGGNVDAFNDFASGFILTSHIVGFASLAALITGHRPHRHHREEASSHQSMRQWAGTVPR